MTEFKHQYLSVNNARIHAVEAGQGPLVLLIHGFPELWYSWRYQLQFLAESGFRAVAFDQRGYGRSSKFWNPEAYRIHRLVDDGFLQFKFPLEPKAKTKTRKTKR